MHLIRPPPIKLALSAFRPLFIAAIAAGAAWYYFEAMGVRDRTVKSSIFLTDE